MTNDQNTVLSARNIADVKTALTNTINVFDILKYNTVVATKAAVADDRGGVRIMADIKYYDVILKPVVTEKSMNVMADKKYTFMVHPDATKSQVKEAVEKMFEGTKVEERKYHELAWQDQRDAA